VDAAPERAIILFAHGARDARWSETLIALRHRVEARAPSALVAVAYLEFQPPTLQQALAAAVERGCRTVDVVPVFWSNGGHIAGDLPPLIDAFRRQHPQVALRVRPVLSELPGLLDFIADRIS
jgi:sirohydrochlorin cobaltochelatase